MSAGWSFIGTSAKNTPILEKRINRGIPTIPGNSPLVVKYKNTPPIPTPIPRYANSLSVNLVKILNSTSKMFCGIACCLIFRISSLSELKEIVEILYYFSSRCINCAPFIISFGKCLKSIVVIKVCCLFNIFLGSIFFVLNISNSEAISSRRSIG